MVTISSITVKYFHVSQIEVELKKIQLNNHLKAKAVKITNEAYIIEDRNKTYTVNGIFI